MLCPTHDQLGQQGRPLTSPHPEWWPHLGLGRGTCSQPRTSSDKGHLLHLLGREPQKASRCLTILLLLTGGRAGAASLSKRGKEPGSAAGIMTLSLRGDKNAQAEKQDWKDA